MDEKILAEKIHTVLGKESESTAKAISHILRTEQERVESSRKALQRRLESELEKLAALRKESREATREEVQRIENLRHVLHDSVEKELKEVKAVRGIAHDEMRTVRTRLKAIDPLITEHVTRLKGATADAVALAVEKRLRQFTATEARTKRALEQLGRNVENVEKRLGNDIIHLTHKTNTLSQIQQKQETAATAPEKTVREMVDSILNQEKVAGMKSEVFVPDGAAHTAKDLKNLIKQVNELKTKVSVLEKETQNKMQRIKDDLIKEALSELERAM